MMHKQDFEDIYNILMNLKQMLDNTMLLSVIFFSLIHFLFKNVKFYGSALWLC